MADKKIEEGAVEVNNDFEGLDLTPNQLRLKKLEIEMNKHIDEKIMENPEKMPLAVWYIIPNELGERFCYYGLTPILKNFLKYQLGYLDKVDANQMYHIFQGLCYYTPILGSLLSDSYLDKFKTIVILSSLYVFGFGLLTITSWPTIMGVETTKLARVGPLLGLLCITLGTGGIKPCVSAHGGDQFLDVQKYGLQKFYNYFYMAINTGALVASYASPAIQKKTFYTVPNDTLALWEKAEVRPTGNGYPQAFLMLTVFMAAALGVFVAGFKTYRVVPPTGKFILIDIFKVAGAYWTNRSKLGKEEGYKKTCEDHTEGMVTEMMDLGKVIMAIWPAPIFWMAFNQNGTVWQDLGDQMLIPFGGVAESSFFDSATVNNIWNPFFIIILAPIFANWLFPMLDKKFGPEKFGLMQRMIAGQFLAGATFILAAVIQKSVNANCFDNASLDVCRSSTSILWQILMYFCITLSEVLFSISGLNFCYIEVGKRTKSFCAALWLFTVGTGSFLTKALLAWTLGADNTTWTRETFFYLVAGMCFGSAAIQYVISRSYVPKALRPTAHL
ncbi:POT family-domain-containing protein [Obelidium mucronatum]|nr:POT family-domain-containing protein [Obelidium mucronatum]